MTTPDISRSIFVRVLLCVFCLLPAILSGYMRPARAQDFNFDSDAAVAWALANNMNDGKPRGVGSKQDIGRDCATYVAGALHDGGLTELSTDIHGNHDIIAWMARHQYDGIWEFRPLDQLVKGDFVLYSGIPNLSEQNYTADNNLDWSHSALVIAPNTVAMWNPEEYGVSIDWYNTTVLGPMRSRLGVHIIRHPGVPRLLSPTADSVLAPFFVFRVEPGALNGAERALFDAQIARDSSFTDIVWTPPNPFSASQQTYVTLSNGDYYVRIRQQDSFGDTSDWTNPVAIHVTSVNSENAPVIVSPTNRQGVANNFTLLVNPGRLNYQNQFGIYYEIASDSNFRDVVVHTEGAWEMSTAFPIGLPGGIYYVRVKQTDTRDHISDWSPPIAFNIVTAEVWGYIYADGRQVTQGPLNMCVSSPSAGWEDCDIQTLSSPWYYRANLDASSGDRRVTISVELPGQAMTECGNGQIVSGRSVQIDCHVG